MRLILFAIALLFASSAFAANPPYSALVFTNSANDVSNRVGRRLIFNADTGTNAVEVYNTGVTLATLGPDGKFSLRTNLTVLDPKVADGASAVAYSLDTANLLANNGSRVLAINNAGTNVAYINKNGGLLLGRSINGWWGPDNATVIAGIRDFSKGEGLGANVYFAALDKTSSSGTNADFEIDLTSSDFATDRVTLHKKIGSDQFYIVSEVGGQTTNVTRWYFRKNSTILADLNPTAAATATAYELGTSTGHTSGSLVNVANVAVSHFTVGATNGITTPQVTAYGAVSSSWQFGSSSNVNVSADATNMVEIVANGKSWLVPAKPKVP